MQNYKIAVIPENCLSEITQLEEKIKQQTGVDVALVAYQPEVRANPN